MAEQFGKSTNGGNEATAAHERASETSQDIRQDLQALQQDVARLTQQIADILASKGSEVWQRARANVDDVIGDAGVKGKEAADAVREVGDTLTSAIDESIERRPYTTLALALGLGLIVGAAWRR